MTFLLRHPCRGNSSVFPCTIRRCQSQNNQRVYFLVNRIEHQGCKIHHRKDRVMGVMKALCHYPTAPILGPRNIDRKITGRWGTTLSPGEHVSLKLCLDLSNSNPSPIQSRADQCKNIPAHRRIPLIQTCRDKPQNKTSSGPRPFHRNLVSDRCLIT